MGDLVGLVEVFVLGHHKETRGRKAVEAKVYNGAGLAGVGSGEWVGQRLQSINILNLRFVDY